MSKTFAQTIEDLQNKATSSNEKLSETLMGCGLAVEIEAMPVEAPGEARVAVKGGRVGNAGEVDTGPAECRIDRPESPGAAKVGEA